MDKSKYQLVRDFHQAFSCPMSDIPKPMDTETVLNRLSFLAEEMIEVLAATAGNVENTNEMYAELLDRMDQSLLKQLEKPFPEDVLTAQADGFTDIDYFNNGNFTLIGTDPDPLFNIVHQANMSKLFPDGKPRYCESDGKIIKPNGWIAPEPLLEAEIQRQIEAAQ